MAYTSLEEPDHECVRALHGKTEYFIKQGVQRSVNTDGVHLPKDAWT
jgi:hypothetical protein